MNETMVPTRTPDTAAANTVDDPILGALATQDFSRLETGLADDVQLRALLPGGYRDVRGRAEVAATFIRWFGDADRYRLLDAADGQEGGRRKLHWRLLLRSPGSAGEGWFVVRQDAYLGTDGQGRITHIDLLCSGYRPATEVADDG